MGETEEAKFVMPSMLDCIEALLVSVTASFGFLVNIASFFVMVRSDSFRNSFGYITAYQALCRASLLLIFAAWATPWTLLLIAIGFPMKYRIMFTNSATFRYLIFITAYRDLTI
ncbi:hypothetical protein ANCCEY_14547 [Ancylostoma ceylanicum]|uniref:7TM GPCR serpentine receptor class x (Srx) domain-containing protein n=1 Tax=Ancylostoma ceylanicum TaxID=53326 RepID=A0A0D6L4Y3_9BILA|nr:hypothetical protein ANCCEY_14547 [Ancylostoma ceylanicum]